MDDLLKSSLRTASLKRCTHCTGGCISDGYIYETDSGKIFVKKNGSEEVRICI